MNRITASVLGSEFFAIVRTYKFPKTAHISKNPYDRMYLLALALKVKIFLSVEAVTKLMKMEDIQKVSMMSSNDLTVLLYVTLRSENAVMNGA